MRERDESQQGPDRDLEESRSLSERALKSPINWHASFPSPFKPWRQSSLMSSAIPHRASLTSSLTHLTYETSFPQS